MPWIPPEVPDDPDANAEAILDRLQDSLPGWVPNDGDPLTALASELGREQADLATLALLAIETAVAGIGETVFGVAPLPATSATMLVELTLSAADTLTTDFLVVGITAGGVEASFAPTANVALPIGVSQVMMSAVTPGEDANGVPTGALTIATATASVVSAVAISTSEDGADAETLDQYLDRLTGALSTLRFGGVRADDLAALARGVAGVHRAYGIDLYNPASPGVPEERTATVFPVDEAGQPVSAGIKADLANYLAGLREVNFQVFVADPTYTAITVAYVVVAEAGVVASTLETEINVAVGSYLSPANWGATEDDPQAWLPSPKVRYLDVARVIGSVPGVAYVQTLTINGGTADVTLTGTGAVLPAANATVSGTVS
jgi:uncharacterized phage protein gp47/JayE